MNEFLLFHASPWCQLLSPANMEYDFLPWDSTRDVMYSVFWSSYEYEPGKQKINSTWPRLGIEPATFVCLERVEFFLFLNEYNSINTDWVFAGSIPKQKINSTWPRARLILVRRSKHIYIASRVESQGKK
jgi:hypothetical protein